MELRALLCWASLATALEGEFSWGAPYPTPGTPSTLRTNRIRRGGGGAAAAWRGVGFFFCLGKRWSRELRPGTFPYPAF